MSAVSGSPSNCTTSGRRWIRTGMRAASVRLSTSMPMKSTWPTGTPRKVTGAPTYRPLTLPWK